MIREWVAVVVAAVVGDTAGCVGVWVVGWEQDGRRRRWRWHSD